ncbi:Synaptotagmin-9 [Oryzias melastigma]|uniref:Synaptotagmin-9 n=1 Tax=Oryzias melastigma TaxID=30732 RepID=A0A834CP43_ORYME|nr:Synaptotagmin-9 [Oryzias melastigma]
MPGDRDDEICQKALELLSDLCSKGDVENENCADFIYYFRDLARPRYSDSDISVSLLSLVVTACGLALFGVSLFVSWKLCWIPWRERGLSPTTKEPQGHINPTMSPLPSQPTPRQPVYTAVDPPMHNRRKSSHCSITKEPTPCGVCSVSGGSWDSCITPTCGHGHTRGSYEDQPHVSRHCTRMLRVKPERMGFTLILECSGRPQTLRQVDAQYLKLGHQGSIRRHMNLSNPDFNVAQFQRQDSLTGMGLGLGRLKPELYQPCSMEGDEGGHRGRSCGRLHFVLKFDCNLEQLIVKIHKAEDLPAKDFSGTSDPYVKIYLLPERKTKHQTKVHRKTLNPIFDEVFLFPVAYSELPTRKLHFTVYDFDRFSRHDIIGQVVVDNFLELADFPRETKLCLDIQYVSSDNVDLGDLMFSLCYLPTAGRLTITMIKARNLKAMDITGASDPYVKVSLMCEGRRLKKRKTSTKRNTLNPIYNEAIVFDVPPENIEQISLLIAVMDYDRVGHNEVIGVCRVGNDADSLGREHWNEMLTYPRKPVAHWHPLVEYQGTTGSSQGGSCNSLKTAPSP